MTRVSLSTTDEDICLSADVAADAKMEMQPLHLECLNTKYCDKEHTYFTRNMTAYGDRMQKMCFFEYANDNSTTSNDICLPPMLTMEIAHVFQPVKEELLENNPDQCGFYFFPYEKQRAQAQNGWTLSVDNIDVTWAPQSYSANAALYPHLDYSLVSLD